MFDQTLQRFPGEVEAIEGRVTTLQIGNDAQRLGIVVEAAEFGQRLIKRPFAGMAKRRMTEVVRQRQRLGEVLIEPKRARQRRAIWATSKVCVSLVR